MEDELCPLNIEGVCFESVAHGFSEKQMREQGKMKLCNMGTDFDQEIIHCHYCPTYQAFQDALQGPGVISPICSDAIYNAKYHDEIDGEIIDLKSKEFLITSLNKNL
jgi:hypothetical protein